MRDITSLQLEKIGDDLCLVLQATDSRFRAIAGRVDPARLEAIGKALISSAETYRSAGGSNYRQDLMNC